MEIQDTAGMLLSRGGFDRYEVSAFSKPDRHCRHNLNYWGFGDYLGIGAGAHSKITTETGIYRDWKIKLPASYMSGTESGSLRSNLKSVDSESLTFEFMLNALRLKQGFDLDDFEARTGLHRDSAIQALSQSLDQQLIFMENGRMGCTQRGYLFIDEILQHLLP